MDTSRKRFVRTWRLLAAVALLALGLVAVAGAQAADPIVVEDGDVYSNQGLVWAIEQANQSGQEIHLAANGSYVLTAVDNTTDAPNGLPSITGTVTIKGNGATIARQDSAPTFRIFHVAPSGELYLHDLTVSNGNVGSSSGGGIYNYGTLTLSNSTVSGNSASYSGGGIYNYAGTLTLSNSTISGNSAYYGGGIYNYGTLTLSNSTISGNSASYYGGIYNYGTRTHRMTQSKMLMQARRRPSAVQFAGFAESKGGVVRYDSRRQDVPSSSPTLHRHVDKGRDVSPPSIRACLRRLDKHQSAGAGDQGARSGPPHTPALPLVQERYGT
jgi:hypothetical protein